MKVKARKAGKGNWRDEQDRKFGGQRAEVRRQRTDDSKFIDKSENEKIGELVHLKTNSLID
jgi:hypothetical protein